MRLRNQPAFSDINSGLTKFEYTVIQIAAGMAEIGVQKTVHDATEKARRIWDEIERLDRDDLI